MILLTEVARKQKQFRWFWVHIKGANDGTNPEVLRIVMKMATSAGKITVTGRAIMPAAR